MLRVSDIDIEVEVSKTDDSADVLWIQGHMDNSQSAFHDRGCPSDFMRVSKVINYSVG